VAVVNVTNFEACTLARKAAWTECVETTLVSELCERIRLVHEL
jgi:hypothetical protein